ncbi:MAG TPA: hypothetical protein VMS40_18655 [Vicinamibacterales bacterium]|nr:hypothetical protein [Vicinamibacterales bacterium]
MPLVEGHASRASDTPSPAIQSGHVVSNEDVASVGALDTVSATTGHGAHDLALTIMRRNSPVGIDAAWLGSEPSHFLQRSRAADSPAPMTNTFGAPVSGSVVSLHRPLREIATGRRPYDDVPGRAGTHGQVYVFRKQTHSGTASPDRPIETQVPPIERVSSLPTVQTEALNVPATESRTAAANEVDGNAGSSAQSAGGMEIDELVERVSRRLFRQLAIENERRGAPTWR